MSGGGGGDGGPLRQDLIRTEVVRRTETPSAERVRAAQRPVDAPTDLNSVDLWQRRGHGGEMGLRPRPRSAAAGRRPASSHPQSGGDAAPRTGTKGPRPGRIRPASAAKAYKALEAALAEPDPDGGRLGSGTEYGRDRGAGTGTKGTHRRGSAAGSAQNGGSGPAAAPSTTFLTEVEAGPAETAPPAAGASKAPPARRRQRPRRSAQEELMRQADLSNGPSAGDYDGLPLHPGPDIMRWLARPLPRPSGTGGGPGRGVRVNVPSTVVLGGDHAVWLETDPRTGLVRRNKVGEEGWYPGFRRRCTESARRVADVGRGVLPIAAVIKAADTMSPGACITTCVPLQQFESRMQQVRGGGSGDAMLQEFLKCRGPHAAVTRVVWSQDRAPYGFSVASQVPFRHHLAVGATLAERVEEGEDPLKAATSASAAHYTRRTRRGRTRRRATMHRRPASAAPRRNRIPGASAGGGDGSDEELERAMASIRARKRGVLAESRAGRGHRRKPRPRSATPAPRARASAPDAAVRQGDMAARPGADSDGADGRGDVADEASSSGASDREEVRRSALEKTRRGQTKLRQAIRFSKGMKEAAGDHAEALAKADEHYLASLSTPARVRVYAVSGKSVREPAAALERAALHLQRVVDPVARIKFAMMAGDFLRDGDGQWWLLKVKAFRLTGPSIERVRFLRAGGLEEPDPRTTRRASALGISSVTVGLGAAEAAEAAQQQRAKRARPQDRTCTVCGLAFTFYQERGPQATLRGGTGHGAGSLAGDGASSQWTAEFGYKLTGNMIHRMVEHCQRRMPEARCFDHFLATQGASAAGGAALAAPYESVKVCKLCYDLYTRFVQLQEASEVAARAMRVPPPRRQSHSGVGVQVPAAKLPPKLLQFRVCCFFHSIEDLDVTPSLHSMDRDTPCSLQYTALHHTFVLPFHVRRGLKRTSIRQVRSHTLFATPDELSQLLREWRLGLAVVSRPPGLPAEAAEKQAGWVVESHSRILLRGLAPAHVGKRVMVEKQSLALPMRCRTLGDVVTLTGTLAVVCDGPAGVAAAVAARAPLTRVHGCYWAPEWYHDYQAMPEDLHSAMMSGAAQARLLPRSSSQFTLAMEARQRNQELAAKERKAATERARRRMDRELEETRAEGEALLEKERGIASPGAGAGTPSFDEATPTPQARDQAAAPVVRVLGEEPRVPALGEGMGTTLLGAFSRGDHPLLVALQRQGRTAGEHRAASQRPRGVRASSRARAELDPWALSPPGLGPPVPSTFGRVGAKAGIPSPSSLLEPAAVAWRDQLAALFFAAGGGGGAATEGLDPCAAAEGSGVVGADALAHRFGEEADAAEGGSGEGAKTHLAQPMLRCLASLLAEAPDDTALRWRDVLCLALEWVLRRGVARWQVLRAAAGSLFRVAAGVDTSLVTHAPAPTSPPGPGTQRQSPSAPEAVPYSLPRAVAAFLGGHALDPEASPPRRATRWSRDRKFGVPATLLGVEGGEMRAVLRRCAGTAGGVGRKRDSSSPAASSPAPPERGRAGTSVATPPRPARSARQESPIKGPYADALSGIPVEGADAPPSVVQSMRQTATARGRATAQAAAGAATRRGIPGLLAERVKHATEEEADERALAHALLQCMDDELEWALGVVEAPPEGARSRRAETLATVARALMAEPEVQRLFKSWDATGQASLSPSELEAGLASALARASVFLRSPFEVGE